MEDTIHVLSGSSASVTVYLAKKKVKVFSRKNGAKNDVIIPVLRKYGIGVAECRSENPNHLSVTMMPRRPRPDEMFIGLTERRIYVHAAEELGEVLRDYNK